MPQATDQLVTGPGSAAAVCRGQELLQLQKRAPHTGSWVRHNVNTVPHMRNLVSPLSASPLPTQGPLFYPLAGGRNRAPPPAGVYCLTCAPLRSVSVTKSSDVNTLMQEGLSRRGFPATARSTCRLAHQRRGVCRVRRCYSSWAVVKNSPTGSHWHLPEAELLALVSVIGPTLPLRPLPEDAHRRLPEAELRTLASVIGR